VLDFLNTGIDFQRYYIHVENGNESSGMRSDKVPSEKARVMCLVNRRGEKESDVYRTQTNPYTTLTPQI